ncbi:MAG: hypothetical protein IPP32_14510 [Bacteroidetes bacterium]|nr:hypothetical protein [Bacteroidota bacterium]
MGFISKKKCKIPKSIHYHLKLETSNNQRTIKEKSINNVVYKKFTFPVTSNHPKIYIVKSGSAIIYVGYTQDSITNRLRIGLSPGQWNEEKNSKSINGYAGYKWRVLDEVNYYVCVFEDINTSVTKEMKYLFENIEAEIVFKLKAKGYWPKYQSEIHFYSEIKNQKPKTCEEVFGKSISDVAQQILDNL